MTDNVNHPSHYERFRSTFEPMDFTKWLPHPLASALEYIIRAPHKGNELEDLRKASVWLNELRDTDGFWTLTPLITKQGKTLEKAILIDKKAAYGSALSDRDRMAYCAAAYALATKSYDVLMLIGGNYEGPTCIDWGSVERLLIVIDSRIEDLQAEAEAAKKDEVQA